MYYINYIPLHISSVQAFCWQVLQSSNRLKKRLSPVFWREEKQQSPNQARGFLSASLLVSY